MVKCGQVVSLFWVTCLIAGLATPFFVVQAEPADNLAFWSTLARNAWLYFQPGVGVDSKTGLPQNSVTSSYFTDWDAGVYVQAVIDAKTLGLIGDAGTWGFDDRINRFLIFLETRPLMADGLPYLAYNSATGANANNIEQVATDAGCLFVALKNLQSADPALKERIDNIVYNLANYTRRQYSVDVLLGETQSGIRQPNIYDYYVTCGFAGFWPDRFGAEADVLLNLIVHAPSVNYSGVVLPSAKINCEPLLMSIFNLNSSDPRVIALSQQAYLAQEARFNQTGKYTAFTEGFGISGFVWEWIVLGDGRTWVIQTGDSDDVDTDLLWMSPIVYMKAATGLLAIYNTPYTQNMVNYLLTQVPVSQHGYLAGIDESGRLVVSCDFGNGLILSAARYAIDNNITVNMVCPTPAPQPTPTTSASIVPSSPSQQLVPQPQPINASLSGPDPFFEPKPTPAPRDSRTALIDVETVAVGFYVLVIVCAFGAVGYMLAKKRYAARNSLKSTRP
jgi:hypothetical protein